MTSESALRLPLILASGSPRRRELLSLAGIEFQITVPSIDETQKRGETPKAMVARVAREKAQAVLDRVDLAFGETLILAADTTVTLPSSGGRTLGKPRSESEAKKMLKALSGREHWVFTGYCLIRAGTGKKTKIVVKTVKTSVHIRRLTDLEIARYVATGEPMDKAGAYGAQGHGLSLIERVNGSFTNVVGLPLTEVLGDLKRIGS